MHVSMDDVVTAIVDLECLTDKDEFPLCETGFFAWDIVANLLYSDGAVAEMFGLDATETASGLPLEASTLRISRAPPRSSMIRF